MVATLFDHNPDARNFQLRTYCSLIVAVTSVVGRPSSGELAGAFEYPFGGQRIMLSTLSAVISRRSLGE